MAAADESYWLRECKRLYDHPYWSRAWILQECVLASELYIQCGSRQFSIRILSEFHRQWHEISPFEWDAMKIFKTRANWHDDSTRTYFWPWTMDHLQAGCFDPRDRIYSAIAIMDPALSIMPDYNKTALELFFEIADQHFEWDEHRLQKINSLAIDLEMVKFVEALQGYDWENAPPAVWQHRLEARAFYKDIKKRPNLTKSEFLAERQLLINKDVSNNEHGLH
ncbi:hypothetical protein E8E11_002461 [Didymella keratinophila]|nr:hypothetical protein E8E11_002461 [Didymella keratinophila]